MSANGTNGTSEPAEAPPAPITLPVFPMGQSEADILARMRAEAVEKRPGLDVSEGSDYGVLLGIYAGEIARAADDTRTALDLGFAQTASGEYLDALGQEYGIERIPAQAATGLVRFYGAAGTPVPIGARVTTAQVGSVPPQTFATTIDAAIASGAAYVDVPVTAEVAGAAGNVPAGSVLTPVRPIAGITRVENVLPMTGGLDEESDDDYRERLLLFGSQRVMGGTPDDYVRWAREVPGVGGAACVPVKYGPGTVSVAVVDTAGLPADQELVDAVLWHIAPPHRMPFAGASAPLTLVGGAVAIPAPSGALEPNVVDLKSSGTGGIRHAALDDLLPQPGIWTIRLRLQLSGASGSAALLRVRIVETDGGTTLPTRPGGTDDSARTWTAAQLGAGAVAPGWAEIAVGEAAWTAEPIRLEIDRQAADATTRVLVDRVVYQSAFVRDTDSADPLAPLVLAPAGHRVTVEPAVPLGLDVAAELVLAPGAVESAILSAAETKLAEYVRSLALPPSGQPNDVSYGRVYDLLLAIAGVADVTGLLLNGAAANVVVGTQEVAVLGTVDLTTRLLVPTGAAVGRLGLRRGA